MASKDRGYVPATSEPQTIMNTARNRNKVIECTGASGVTHSFIHSGVGSIWVLQRSNMDVGTTVNAEREDAMENCIRRCDPDVRLVDESVSVFGSDS